MQSKQQPGRQAKKSVSQIWPRTHQELVRCKLEQLQQPQAAIYPQRFYRNSAYQVKSQAVGAVALQNFSKGSFVLSLLRVKVSGNAIDYYVKCEV